MAEFVDQIPQQPGLEFEEKKHQYVLNGTQVLPSVTTLMKPLSDTLYAGIRPETLQQVVQKRMDEKERKLAVESKEKRNKEFEELTVNGNIIHTGRYAGKLLVDELMKDLMEAAATA